MPPERLLPQDLQERTDKPAVPEVTAQQALRTPEA